MNLAYEYSYRFIYSFMALGQCVMCTTYVIYVFRRNTPKKNCSSINVTNPSKTVTLELWYRYFRKKIEFNSKSEIFF